MPRSEHVQVITKPALVGMLNHRLTTFGAAVQYHHHVRVSEIWFDKCGIRPDVGSVFQLGATSKVRVRVTRTVPERWLTQ